MGEARTCWRLLFKKMEKILAEIGFILILNRDKIMGVPDQL